MATAVAAALESLGYGRVDAADAALLGASGPVRWHALEWLLARFDAGVCGLPENASLPEDQRVECIHGVFALLGWPHVVSLGAVRGASPEMAPDAPAAREALALMVDLIEFVRLGAGDQAVAQAGKADALMASVARERSDVFVDDCRLLPSEIRAASARLPDAQASPPGLADLERSLAALQKQIDEVQGQLDEVPEVGPAGSAADAERVAAMAGNLRQAVDIFLMCYAGEFQPWQNQTKPPLSGIGPAAEGTGAVLDGLAQLLGDIATLRQSQRKIMAGATATPLEALEEFGEEQVARLRAEVATLERAVARRRRTLN